MATSYSIIQVRRGTAAQWFAVNPLLSSGEMGLETDTGKYKFGDGVTYWNNLSYSPSTIQLKRSTAAGWVTINPILLDGEPGFETDTGKFKIGNGVTNWASLSYYSSGGGSSTTENGIGPQVNFKISGAAATGTKQDQVLLGSEFAGGIALSKIRIYSDVAPVGAALIVDINRNGTSIWAANPGNRVQVAAGANYGTQTSFDSPYLYEGDIVSIDVDQVGSSTPGGNNLTVVLDFDWAGVLAADLLSCLSLPEGYMSNGTIQTSIVSNQLVVAIKDKAGNDPSTTSPVVVNIAGIDRTLTSALSLTVTAGNWFRSGINLIGKEHDLFVYMGWKTATSSLVLTVSRRPDGLSYGDFSATYNADNAMCVSASMASTDRLENVGRVNAINSGSPNYYWSLPTSSYPRSTPTFTTDFPPSRGVLVWVPTLGGFAASPAPTVGAYYGLSFRMVKAVIYINGVSNGASFTFLLPFCAKYAAVFPCKVIDDTTNILFGQIVLTAGSDVATVYKDAAGSAWTAAGGKQIYTCEIIYEVL